MIGCQAPHQKEHSNKETHVFGQLDLQIPSTWVLLAHRLPHPQWSSEHLLVGEDSHHGRAALGFQDVVSAQGLDLQRRLPLGRLLWGFTVCSSCGRRRSVDNYNQLETTWMSHLVSNHGYWHINGMTQVTSRPSGG